MIGEYADSVLMPDGCISVVLDALGSKQESKVIVFIQFPGVDCSHLPG